MSLAYPLFPHHATHPEHLLAIARWQGVDTAELAGLRILELGCAAGANLLPMAVRMPEATVVGVDLAEHEIARGQALAARAGARLDLRCADVATVALDQPFDLIIAHGLLSWVPETVEDGIFALLERSLAPGGVAYLSANIQEGWQHRGKLREWLLARVAADVPEEERVRQARALLDDVPAELASLAGKLRTEDDAYLSQDYLAAFNRPTTVAALTARARRAGLRSLGEVNGLSIHLGGAFLPAVQAATAAVGSDPVAIEAHLDRQEQRSFRATAFARTDAPVTQAGPQGLFFTTRLRLAEGSLAGSGPATLTHPWGARTTLADPGVKRLLGALIDAWPLAVSFDELEAMAGPHTVPILSILCGHNLVHPRLTAGRPRVKAQRPRVPADVRVLVADGSGWAADAQHRGHRTDAADRALLPLLDGSRSVGELRRQLGWSKGKLDRELASAWDRGLREG